MPLSSNLLALLLLSRPGWAELFSYGHKTYSVNSSCYTWMSNFDDAVEEVFMMARRGAERLKMAARGRDHDFARVFQLVMKTPITDPRAWPAPPMYAASWRRPLRYPPGPMKFTAMEYARRACEFPSTSLAMLWSLCEQTSSRRWEVGGQSSLRAVMCGSTAITVRLPASHPWI